MKVRDCMNREVVVAAPDHTIQVAAQTMEKISAGFLPVCDDRRVVGIITDRDIAIRAVAADLPSSTEVREVMTEDVKYCFDDNEVDDVLANMREIHVRRLPVVTRDKDLVGILSIADVAREREQAAGEGQDLTSHPGAKHPRPGKDVR